MRILQQRCAMLDDQRVLVVAAAQTTRLAEPDVDDQPREADDVVREIEHRTPLAGAQRLFENGQWRVVHCTAEDGACLL